MMSQVQSATAPLSDNRKPLTTVPVAEISTPPPTPPPQSPRTISELISVRAQSAPNQVVLGYPRQGVDYVEYTYGQINDFVTAGAHRLACQLPARPTHPASTSVVALLGPSTLEYLITALALSRLGWTVLLLSTRISEAAFVSLLTGTGCTRICVSHGFEKTIDGIQKQLLDLQFLEILRSDQLHVEGLDYAEYERQLQQPLDLDRESQRIVWIMHSSGSTGLPKPIFQTHASAIRNFAINLGMEGFVTLPLFHAFGLCSVFRGIYSMRRVFMYNASLPITSGYLLETMRNYRFEILCAVPYVLKLLSESEEGIRRLAQMKVVMFGGSACPDGLGDMLTEHGVNLIGHYGSTETGQLMSSFRPAGDKAWNYLRVGAAFAPFARFEPRDDNLYELVVLDGWPSKVATNRDDGSYAMKDLFEPHPTIEGAWRYGGRLDDVIVLNNGEKAIPLAMEMAVRQQPLVKDAIVFGTGKAKLGMMIIAAQAAAQMNASILVEKLWPTIEAENKNGPAYAEISRDMIEVLPSGTVYPQTDKGTLIRPTFYRVFADQIEAIYPKLESAASGTLVLNDLEQRDWLRQQILALSPDLKDAEITDETDLFSLGLDSLQSSRLRQQIMQDIQLNGHKLSYNVVFENPSLAQLAAAITSTRSNTTTATRNIEEEMTELIAKYGQFPQHEPVQSENHHKITVVTGVTGSLGAHIVAQLAVRDDIAEICCLVRASSQEAALTRTHKSMMDRAVFHSLSPEARRKIVAHPSDFSKADLGLAAATYDHIKSGIMSLIHCAWSVNFNKQLSSFEADCIAGTRNLILLCLAAQAPRPASFNFCSSISTVARYAGAIIPEGLPETLTSAQGMGYGPSKLVAEHVIAKAAEQTGISARVLRVGQIVADTVHGIWNDTEAVPLMLQSAVTIGALPALDETSRWLPVDVVASTMNDISLSTEGGNFFNVVNPNTFHWTRDLLPALEAAGLSFERVNQREWVRKLRISNSDVVANPTFKLLEFFTSKYDNNNEARPGLPYQTQAVEIVSPSIRNCPALTQDLVTKFVQHFLSTSWKTSESSSQP